VKASASNSLQSQSHVIGWAKGRALGPKDSLSEKVQKKNQVEIS